MDKKSLSERDICSKFIAPAITKAGWDMHKQVREEVSFTKGRIIVRGKLHSRGEARRADFILYHQANLPIAVIEAKDNKHSVGSGMQQALGYAEALDVPFVFSSNGDGFVFRDATLADGVHISAASVVMRSISKPGQYSGVFPLDDNASWEKNAATLRQLHTLRDRLRALEKKMTP